MTHRLLIAACFLAAGAVPAFAQSNSANEGAAAPDGTQAAPQTAPLTLAPVQDQQQAQRQANSDPYNMPQNRAAASARASEQAAADKAKDKDNTPADADKADPAR